MWFTDDENHLKYEDTGNLKEECKDTHYTDGNHKDAGVAMLTVLLTLKPHR